MALRAPAATPASLCVEMQAQNQAGELGQVVTWMVTAWTTGGNVPGVIIQLQTTPGGSGTPHFSLGCGAGDGTSVCSLGTLDSGAARRQFEAQDTVPVTAASVTSVTLIATGTATGLTTAPIASGEVLVSAPATPVGATSTLPGVTVPGVSSSATLSPGGSAAGLFPTVAPSTPATPSAPSAPGATGTTGAAAYSSGPGTFGGTPVANTVAIGQGSSSLGPQVVGLAVLGVALVLAVARVSIRRPAASRASAAAAVSGAAGSRAGGSRADAAETAPDEASSDDPEM